MTFKASWMKVAMIILSLMWLSTSSLELDKNSKQLIAERIAPIGKICRQGDSCATRAHVFVSMDDKGKNRSGQEVYNRYCTMCHESGIQDAPLKDDLVAWKMRLEKAGDFEKLVLNAIKGVGAMPAKGTCNDCSMDEMVKAIVFMSGLKPNT